ncbi:MAG TPA: tetratricopeptide repeat protein, partial [Longimicrobiales bacterium]
MIFLKDLLRRRVPQVTAIYLGASWGLIQFVDFVAQRYALSPHLTDLAIILPLLLLPSVVLVTYFHGAPGKDQWVLAERVGVPVNVIVAAAVMVLFVRGKDLGAATTTVTVTDEDGVEVERVIPKSEFRKRLSLFYFDAPAGDTAAAWLQYGLTNAIASDLSQDHFIDLRVPALFADRLREAGFEELTGVPLSLQRQVAEEQHRDHFVRGTVAVEAGEVRATVALYEVASGKAVEEREYTGASVLEMTDRITEQLRADLEVPELRDASVRDLPVSEVLTSNLEAFRTFIEGAMAIHVDRDYAAGTAAMLRATELDPTFAAAQYALAQLYYLTNRTPEAAAPLQAAMDHLYRIPERSRFQVKSDYYFIVRQDVDKALASIVMWGDLFPDDVQAFQARLQIQAVRDDRTGMLESLRTILELDPEQKDVLLQMGNLHQAMGDLSAAREAFQRYADEFPENTDVLRRLASVSRSQGNLEQARDYLDRALLLEPSDVAVMVAMGSVLRGLGDFDGALAHLQDALAGAGTPEEQIQAHGGLEAWYRMRGRVGEAVTHLEARMAAVMQSQPGLLAVQTRLREAPRAYVEAGRDGDALAVVEEARAQLPPPFNAFVPLGEMAIHLERD